MISTKSLRRDRIHKQRDEIATTHQKHAVLHQQLARLNLIKRIQTSLKCSTEETSNNTDKVLFIEIELQSPYKKTNRRIEVEKSVKIINLLRVYLANGLKLTA